MYSFMTDFQIFQNTQTKNFSWGLFWLKSEILGWRPATLVERKILQIFLGGFQNFRAFFPFGALFLDFSLEF